MSTTSEEVIKTLKKTDLVNDLEKLKKQQDYYKRLTQNGTAKKQTYNLK